MSRLPVDHAVRERASTALGTSVALTAGAGAGKTSVLVRRVARALIAGTDPARVAAITFTEKAAGEILHRVRIELEATGSGLGPDAVTKVTVATLHSFARSLLAAEPLEAAWAPGAEVAASASPAAEVDAWWAGFRAREPALAERIGALCTSGQRTTLAAHLLAHRDLSPRTGPVRTDEERFEDLRRVRQRIEDEAARCRSESCKLLRSNDPLRAEMSRWMTLRPSAAVHAALGSAVGPRKVGGKASDWPDGVGPFKEALDGLAAWRQRVGADLHGVLVREMGQHVVPAVLQARTRGGRATFDDLLFRAAELLRDHDAVRRRLAARYDAVLIDEVQDTDPLQAEVALLLAREATATGPWTDAPPRPGALFAVGDRQQSIYRFRRADVRTWGELSETVARGGESLALSQNFRSVPGILDWVRQVFGAGAHPQVAWRGPAVLDPVVILRSDEENELEHAVAWAHEVLRAGQVVDRDSGEPRAVTPSDLLFLVPRWRNADALANRLERAGIRAEVEGGKTFFARDEVRLGVAVLSCLVEPGDTASTALVLRGLFGVTLADLVRHRAAGGTLRLTVPDPPPGPVGAALRALAAVRSEAGGSLVDLLDRTLDEVGAAAAWVLRADAASRFANLDKLRKLLRDEERAGGTRLEVLERINELAWNGEDDELSLTEPDQEAARITTIFKAKGLEAPIAVLVDLHKQVSTPDCIVLRERGEVLVRVSSGLRPPGWDDGAEAEKAEMQQELERLAYVAATRARDQLVIVQADKRNLIEVLSPGIPASRGARERVAVGAATVLSVPGEALAPAPDERAVFPGWDEAIDRGLRAAAATEDVDGRERVARLARRVRAAKRASTRWEAATARAAKVRGRGRPLEGSGLGPEAARLGEALHKVMEHLDLRRPRDAQAAEVDRLAPAMLTLLAVDDPQGPDKVRAAARRILDHPIMDSVRSAKRHLKEVPFVTGDGRTRVTGTIDLAFPRNPEETVWQVVDWKIHVPAGGPGRAQYDAQLRLYAKAVLAGISPCERVETALVGPHAELPVPEPEDRCMELVLDAMKPLLAALLQGGAPPPEVGLVLGDDLEAELVWEQQRVAVLDGPAEDVDGWVVFGSEVQAETVLEALGARDPA